MKNSQGSVFNMLTLLFSLIQKLRHIKQLPVDLKALQDGLSSLLIPSQKVMFSQHVYAF